MVHDDAIYTRSSGEQLKLKAMTYPQLKNSAEALRRRGDPRSELPAMDERLAAMEAEYRAEHPEAGE